MTDKQREARDGHDGTWVAHPGLVGIARDAFSEVLAGANQLGVSRDDFEASSDELLEVPRGARTESGLRHDVRVGIRYLESWLAGKGCVPLYGLMEDAATAEISRAQVWQWLAHGARLDDGRRVDRGLVGRIVDEELESIREEVGSARFGEGEFGPARELFEELCYADELIDFLTLPGYERLCAGESSEAPSDQLRRNPTGDRS